MPFELFTRVSPRNHVWDNIQFRGAVLRENEAAQHGGVVQRSTSSKRLSRRQYRYGVDADWVVLDGGTHWRNLANTTEPSACSGDAVLLLEPLVKLHAPMPARSQTGDTSAYIRCR